MDRLYILAKPPSIRTCGSKDRDCFVVTASAFECEGKAHSETLAAGEELASLLELADGQIELSLFEEVCAREFCGRDRGKGRQ